MSNYPKWLYKGKESVLVNDEQQEKALAGGWADTPHGISENVHSENYSNEEATGLHLNADGQADMHTDKHPHLKKKR